MADTVLDAGWSERQLNTLVDKTLQNLGLAHIRDLKVGSAMDKSISGGERKRVNIGLELLRAPQVLFVDEPTSGLSSRDSVNVMELLKELSEQGKLVFVVIHQPSSDIYKMFDRLIILDTGGYPIYYGNPVEAIRYFKARTNQVGRDQPLCHECGHVNPEQIFDIVETRQVNEYGQYTSKRRYAPTWWNEQFLTHIRIPNLRVRATAVLHEYKKAPILRQLITFITRDVLSKLNNQQYLAINLLEAPALAILLAYVFKYYKTDELTTSTYIFQENDNIPVYLFISIIVALFLGLTVSAEEIFKDRRILKREAFLHLSKNAYITSKMVILFAISALQCLMFTWIGNFILDIKAMDAPMWAVLFSVSCFANMLGLNISSAFNSAITIYILIPILLIPQLVLGGLVIKFDQINPAIRNGDAVPMYGEIMASRWAFEALMVSQFKDNPHQKPLYRFDQTLALADYRKTYLLPVLESKIEYCDHHNGTRDVATIKQIDKELRILGHQLRDEQRITGKNMHLPAELNYKHYTSKLSRTLRADIANLRTHYDQIFNKTYKAKDAYVTAQISTPTRAARYVAQAQAYTNNSVADVVKNSQSQIKIVQEGDHLIQKAFPIYLEPEGREGFLNFRTHFYAPVKHFIGQRIPTLWFNLGMIWLMSALLYVTLYYNSLARFLRVFAGK